MLRSRFADTYGPSRGGRSRGQTARPDRCSGAPSTFSEMRRLRVCLACRRAWELALGRDVGSGCRFRRWCLSDRRDSTGLNIFSLRPPLTQHRFILLQRVAHYGAMTIVGVLEDADKWDSANRLQALAGNAYAWEKALRVYFDIDVIRAWKDPQYRENLSPCEKGLVPPHPSGEVDLKDIQLDASSARAVVGFSTWTLYGICCCTGDLCPAGTNTDYKCCRTSDIECGIIT